MKKLLLQATILTVILTSLGGVTASAAQNNGYGQGQGRTDSININDYSTSAYDRFSEKYQFESGENANKDMGRPTHTNVVPKQNPLTTNVQRNKDATFTPPSYGVFSGSIDTERTNPYFSPANYSNVRNTTDYTDTGVGNVLNGSNADGILPSTSLMNGNGSGNSNASLPSTTAQNQGSTGIPQLPKSTQNVSISYAPQPKTAQTSRQSDLKTEAWLY